MYGITDYIIKSINSLTNTNRSFNYLIGFTRITLKLFNFLSVGAIQSINNTIFSIFIKPKINCKFHKETINNIDCFYINKESNNRTIVLFFHGGGYAFLSPYHYYNFLTDIDKKLAIPDLNIIAIDYPKIKMEGKTTINTYPTQIDSIYTLYNHLIDKYPKSQFILMGDSAGSNLSIELMSKIIEEGVKKPKAMVLLSPWIIKNEDLQNNSKKNCVLNYKIINRFRRLYINNHPKYRSTLAINFREFPKTLIRYGSEELFVEDIENFIDKFRHETIEKNVVQKIPGMPHSFDIINDHYKTFVGNELVKTNLDELIDYIRNIEKNI
jgi:acetyl esterase/lipase